MDFARSLNEPGQPRREGGTADELRAALGQIIDWLAVDNPDHKRYQPAARATYCNIYAHDYCHLAGIYLPRVWWTQKSIQLISQGNTVAPHYGNSIEEMQVDNIVGWLKDFGADFGWRRTGTLSKLQQEVNQGAVGLIVAKSNNSSHGHVAVVVPESPLNKARRNRSGEVIAPLQSQAGSVNFRYGTGRPNWWVSEKFSESSFWLHG